MLRSLLALSLIYCTTATALAQSSPTPPPTTAPTAKSVTDWPSPNRFPTYSHALQVITLARPGVRQRCDLQVIDTDSITCMDRNWNRIHYQRDEIAAIVDPRGHGDLLETLLFSGFVIAALTGSFFVPLGWSVFLRCVTVVYLGVLSSAASPASGRNHDHLLYQHPNTTLTVHLH
jgi:hypothetical protein